MQPVPTRRILIVEDDPSNARMLALALKSAGYEVATANSVGDALAIIGAERPVDLILSDLSLPDGTAYDLMAELRANGHMRGVVLSGHGSPECMRASLRAGFARHLVKPVDLSAVRDAVREVLAAE